MKKKSLLMMLLMLIGFSMAKAEIVEIGSGVNSNDDVYWLPTDMNHNYSVVQSIYKSSEIGVTGTINSISYYKITERSITRNLDIYMVQTDKSSFQGTTSDWIRVTAADKVFSGEVTYAEGSGWNKITFDTPYEYNKNKNLAVIVDDNTNFSLGGAGIWFRATRFLEPTVWMSYHADSDEVDINPVSISGTLGSSMNTRAQIRLDITPIGKNTVKCGGGLKTSQELPTQYSASYWLSQQIYTADEIGMAGTIKSFSIKTGNKNFGTGFLKKVKIYMAHTTKSSFSSQRDFIDMSTAVLVYEKEGWIPRTYNWKETFTLDTPFDYDGTSNLALIWVDTPGNNLYPTFLTYDAPGQAIYANNSQGTGAFDLTHVYPNTGYYSGYTRDEKNQVWFDIIPSTAIGVPDNTTDALPLVSSYKYSFTEQLYTSEEIGRSGFINGISFYCSDISTTPISRSVSVYIAKTNKSSFESKGDWITFGDGDKVFSGTMTIQKNSWVKITFDKPFRYTGSGNIVIGVDDNTGNSTANAFFRTFTTSSAQALFAYSSTTDFDPRYSMSSVSSNTLVSRKNQIMLSFQDEWQVGEGTEVSTYLPTFAYYNYSLTQQIYTKEDLGQETGDITSLAFYNTNATTTRNLEIYLTDPTSFTSYPRTDAYYASQAVPSPAAMVFSGEVTFAKNEWTDIPLNKAYHWSYAGGGAHSFVVTVIDKTGSYVTPYPVFLTYPAQAQAVAIYRDNSPFSLEDMRLLSQNAEKIVNSKNQIQFNNVGLNPKPVGLHAADLTYRSATIKWYGEGGTNGWNFEYKKSTETEWIRFGLPKSQTSYPLSDLEPCTIYDIRVQMVNGSDAGEWLEAQFSTDLCPTNLEVTDITYETANVKWGGPGSMWRLEFAKAGEGWTVLEENLTTKSYTLTGLEQDQYYSVRVFVTDETGFYGQSAYADFNTPELYPKPTGLVVKAVTTYTAAIDWNENGDATAWQIEAWIDGEEGENVLTYTTSTKPFIMTGLQQGSHYDFRVRSIIDAANEVYGNWSIYHELYTMEANPVPVIATVIPTPNSVTINWDGQSDSYKVRYRKFIPDTPFFEESFETDIDDLKSKGWQFLKKGEAPTDDGWIIHGYQGCHNGSSAVVAYSWTSEPQTYDANNWLISPLLDLQGTLKYWEWVNSDYKDSYEVLLSTTGTNIETDFTTTLRPFGPGTENWTEVAIDLSEYAGQQGYIAFHHEDYNQMYLVLDDFGLYDISAQEEWQTIETDEMTVTIEGLESDTEYEFEVLGVVRGIEDSTSGIESFTTLNANPAPYDVVVNAEATTAEMSWKGNGDEYIVEYREKYTTDQFFEDFETASLYQGYVSTRDWTVYTLAEHLDGKEGWFADGSSTNLYAGSRSYQEGKGKIQADNWLITPKVPLGGTLKYKVRVNKGWVDKYEVLLSTTGTNIEDFTETLRALAPADDTDGWVEVSISLSVYEGQQGYIAIHHYDKGKNYLEIDDFGIYLTSPVTIEGPWQSVTVSDPECTLTGLTPNSTVEYRITSRKRNEENATTEILSFTTGNSDPIEWVFDNDGVNMIDIYSLNGSYVNATINNLTFKAGVWTAICLPFDVNVDFSVLLGADVRTIESAQSINEYYIIDCLTPVYYMNANTPYIVKWNGNSDLVNPTFRDVTINAHTGSSITKDNVTFISASYDACELVSHMPGYYGLDNETGTMLRPRLANDWHGAFEPDFRIDLGFDDIIYILNTGDNPLADGISAVKSEKDEVIYNVAGQRLGKVQKGINIVNGKKVLVK